jgi:hypothetical protein
MSTMTPEQQAETTAVFDQICTLLGLPTEPCLQKLQQFQAGSVARATLGSWP